MFKKRQREAAGNTDNVQMLEEELASINKNSMDRPTNVSKTTLAEEEAIKNLEIIEHMDMPEEYTRLAMVYIQICPSLLNFFPGCCGIGPGNKVPKKYHASSRADRTSTF